MAERGMARRQYQQAYYQSRKEELQKRHREYYWAHREQVLAKYREKRKKSVKRRSIGKHYHKLNTERMEKVVEKL